jgi:ornithine cyclodeaminase/alanine dehydrogenase-like protein (mu-crystallin family)
MQLLLLSEADVHELLSYRDCVEAMRFALTALAAGQAHQPLRSIVRAAAAPGLMGLMPAYLAAGEGIGDAGLRPAAYGLKAIYITPGNPAIGLDAHQGLVLLADGQTGVPTALLNASAVTEIRTAAVSVLATEALARPGAADLAVIGTGVQARAHVLAFSQTRVLRRIRVAGTDQAKAQALVAGLRPKVSAELIASASAAEAVAGADIVVTATTSAEPVVRREWIAPGTHINAIGAYLPTTREVDGPTVAAAALFTDSRESLLAEGGDYLLPLSEGVIGPGHLRGELGQVLAGSAPGRADDDEITVFKALGLAVEDLAAAVTACQNAERTGAGQRVSF